MAVVGGLLAGVFETFLVFFIWKKFEVELAGWQNIKQKITLILSVLFSGLISILVLGKGYTITNCFNVLIFYTILLAISGIDYQKKIIPNRLLITGMGIRIVLLCMEYIFYPDTFKRILFNSLIGMIFGFGLMMILCWVSKHGIGFGDVKLFAWIGFCVGLNDTYSILFYSALTAAVVGSYLLLVKKESRKKAIPFGPFVCVGAYIVNLLLLIS